MHTCFPSERSRSFEHTLEELDEIRVAVQASGLERGVFLAQAFAPLNERIATCCGQLIALRTRLYKKQDFSSNPEDEMLLTPKERIQAGLITEQTRIVAGTNESAYDAELVSGVRVLYPQDKFSLERTSLSVLSMLFGQMALPILYFRDRPPVADGKTFFDEKKSRLELYIGDAEALSHLQSQLKGYEYIELRRLSGRDLSLTPALEKKIREEQLETYEGVQSALRTINTLTRKRNARLDAIAQQGSEAAFDHGTHIELASEGTERMRWNPQIREAQDALAQYLRQAKERHYDTEGMMISIDIDVGVKTDFDVKEYFSHKLRRYASLLERQA